MSTNFQKITATFSVAGAALLAGCNATMPTVQQARDVAAPAPVSAPLAQATTYVAKKTTVELTTDTNGVQYFPNGLVVPPATVNACSEWQRASAQAARTDRTAQAAANVNAGSVIGNTMGVGNATERAIANPRAGLSGVVAAAAGGAIRIGATLLGTTIATDAAQKNAEALAEKTKELRQACVQETAVKTQTSCNRYNNNTPAYSSCANRVMLQSPIYRVR